MGVAEGTIEWLDRDLEARKHLWKGLARLSVRRRVAFVQSLCGKSNGRNAGLPSDRTAKVESHTGSVQESYLDCCYLAVLHGQSLLRTCEELERWLRRL
jgi:hypothetical protein